MPQTPVVRPSRHVFAMCCPSLAAPLLLLLFHLISVKAEMLLVKSRPEHEGSVAIAGENKVCKTVVEAALGCELTDDCRGMWYYQNGTRDYCQAARCPPSPGIMNPAPQQSGFFFLFTGIFKTGNSMMRYTRPFDTYVLVLPDGLGKI